MNPLEFGGEVEATSRRKKQKAGKTHEEQMFISGRVGEQ